MMTLMRFFVCLLIFTASALAQEPPDWAKREYDAPASKVFAAALKSIQTQKHEVQTRHEDIFTVDFHVGITAWSWGYNMRLVVTPVAENRSEVTVGVLKSGGKVFSWGSGKKEVRKIFGGIDAELISAKTEAKPSPKKEAQQEHDSVPVPITSEPDGADVELDGQFVGNTPLTLRLKPGEYNIRVVKAKYAPWARQLTVLPNANVSLKAELKAELEEAKQE